MLVLMSNQQFADNLRRMMPSTMKPADLAKASGLSKATISEYLSGKYIPKQNNLARLAHALNCLPTELFLIDDPDADTLQEKIAKLSADNRVLLDKYVDYLLSTQNTKKSKEAYEE